MGPDGTGWARWQRRGAHMWSGGGRCQVQGWGQSLPPSSDGSARFPARGRAGVLFLVQGKYLHFTGKFNLSLELDPLYGFNIRSFTAQRCKGSSQVCEL